MHLSDEQLSAYLDSELAPGEAEAAAAHLRRCAACAGALRRYRALDGELVAAPALACSAVAIFHSAEIDGELKGEESAIAAAHLAACAACREDVRRWSALDRTIAALPASRPSARVDAAVAAVAARERAPRLGRLGGAWPLPTLAVVTAISLILVLSLPTAGPTLSRPPQVDQGPVFVASAQQSALNASTGTLYVLQPDRGTVAALDAKTLVQKAVFSVGGKPTALALNVAANTVLVLDPTNKTVTELDGSLTKVTGSTAVTVPGTPTTLQVDAKGNLIVTTVVAADAAAPSTSTSAGVIATFSGDTKQLESVKQLDIAPQVVVLEPNGRRALLVSASATTLVDASTYQPLAMASGGVAAAFSAASDNFAILSNGAAGATVAFARGSGSLVIGGTPHAITALPGGGFAILADTGGRGVITVLNPDGLLAGTIDAPANAHDLAYDPLTRAFAVIGPAGVASVPIPSSLTQVATGPANPAPTGTPLPTPRTTPAPSARPTPAPTAPVVVVAPREKDSLVPTGARALWPGTYLVSVGLTQRPTRAVSDGSRIWYLDQANRVNVLHMLNGELLQIAALPPGASVTGMAVSPNHVYFVDGPASALYALTISTEQVSRIPLGFATAATAIAASPDERLWLATGASGLVSYDPRTGQIERVAVGANLSVVATDSLGRVWMAARDRQAIDLYDPLARKLTEFSLSHGGAITALAVDRANTVWVGTDTGQTFAIRSAAAAGTSGALVTTGLVGRPISGFALDPSGALYYVSRTESAVAYGTVQFPAGARVSPASASEPMFDFVGRAWQSDLGAGFYVTLPEGRT